MKGTFFTPRHLRLMGLQEPEEPSTPRAGEPPRCCEKAEPDMCFCQAPGWKCPVHGARSAPCNPSYTHD